MKAGGGAILATSPPYTKFLGSGIDFAVIIQGTPRDDMWVLEFLNHKIPCVLVDYLVEYICRPDYARDDHVLYDTIEWADKSLANHETRYDASQELYSFIIYCSMIGIGYSSGKYLMNMIMNHLIFQNRNESGVEEKLGKS